MTKLRQADGGNRWVVCDSVIGRAVGLQVPLLMGFPGKNGGAGIAHSSAVGLVLS